MSKKIIDKDGNTYIQKKPFYKRVWFWVLAIIVLIFFIRVFNGSNGSKPTTSNESANSTSSVASSSKEKKQTEFKLTDTVDLNGVKFKVNNVSFSDGDDISTPDQGKQYVKVNITITNTSDDSFDYNSLDFKLNDKGNQTDLDEITTDNDTSLNSGTLSKGGSVTGTMTGQAIKGDKLQLLYKGSILEKDEKFAIDLN